MATMTTDPTATPLTETPAGKQWNTIGVKHHHGINLPLSSLHSATSGGIGEFPDLHPLIDWCQDIGLDVIQLLPLNDSGRDSSPYNALSALALHPIYLSIAALPNIDKHPDLQDRLTKLQKLNQTTRVEYGNVRHRKDQILRGYYAKEFPALSTTTEYQSFLAENSWLSGYALFKALKTEYDNSPWTQWPTDVLAPTPKTLTALAKQHRSDIDYHSMVQYFCFQQMHQVKDYATKRGVFIKGDIPILLSPDSADVWQHRNLFVTTVSAGSPPDAFAVKGQNWGFPLYNWDAIAADNDYGWWRQRLKVATHLYHLYRLDHIVGFFRIWAVPKGQSGRHGSFVPEDKTTWIAHGKKILTMMLEACPMLPIGEDLGTVPDDVRRCLRELGICGTKVVRWERVWDEDERFIAPEDYLQASMTTVSTHDSATLHQWWRDEPESSRTYAETKGWPYDKHLSLQQRKEILRESHHTKSLFHINLLQEYLALAPDLVWPYPDDERINTPGTTSNKNWTYRCRPSVEEIVDNEFLRQSFHDLLEG